MDEFQDIDSEHELHRTLWERFQKGDVESFETLTETFYPPLLNYALKLSQDKDFAADCLQELFLELWERRRRLSNPFQIRSYLFKAIRNKVIKESIKLRRFREPIELEFFEEVNFPVELSIVASELEREKINQLKDLLSSLTRRQKEIVYLRFYQNLEYDQISDIMGLTRQSVANLLHRTLSDLRKKWIVPLLVWFLMGCTALYFRWLP